MDGIKVFNQAIHKNLLDNRKFLSGRKGYLPAYAKIASKLKKQEKIRERILQEDGVTVPPILIISVTNDCNLQCTGCYACSQHRNREEEMTLQEIDSIVEQGIEQGVGIVMIAGGEPLMKEGILTIPQKYKDTLFVMFTNGTMIGQENIDKLKKLKNLVITYSLEGDEKSTDDRRGFGVYGSVMGAMDLMDREKIIFGTSITLTSRNYSQVMNQEFLWNLESRGCRTLFLIEYVPCNGDKELCLKPQQKEGLLEYMDIIKKNYSMLPVPLPGDEESFGGCLAAGRGFLHISSTGSVEACPFAAISDVNLKRVKLKDALQSELLKKIRENHHLLTESEGGCALYENREFVESLAAGENI